MQAGRISSQQDLDAEQQLEDRLRRFDLWADTADRSDVCWEYAYPEWPKLASKAEQVMAEAHQSEHSLFLLGRCWALSEEGEECTDWAREHVQDNHVRETILRLTVSADPRTRWQACDVLGDLPTLDADTVKALEAGAMDDDAYVRRRAFLALRRHGEEIDVQPYIKQMLLDADAYNRYVAVKEGRRRNIRALQSQMDAAAQDPEVASRLDYYENHKETIDYYDER